MNIDLKEMTQLAPIFRELFKGYHLSRSEPEPYAQLSNMQDQYRALFKALGFELVCDPRGFYYFVPEQMGAQVNKTAQRLALFTFILVEHLADQGRDPLAVLDGGSLGRDELPALLDKYRDLFLQAEVTTQEELEEKVIRRLTQLGLRRGQQRRLPLPATDRTASSTSVCRCSRTATVAASLHSSDLPLPAELIAEDDSEDDIILIEEAAAEESEEDALDPRHRRRKGA